MSPRSCSTGTSITSTRSASAWPAEWDRREGTLLPMGKGIDRDAWGAKVPADVAAKADACATAS